jgi:YHS domain-containing protein
MKNALLLCIMMILVASLGCGEKEEVSETEQTEQAQSVAREKPKVVARAPQAAQQRFDEKFLLIDPVSKEKLMGEETPYTYVYKKRIYFFKTEENLKTFKGDPEKYIAELE